MLPSAYMCANTRCLSHIRFNEKITFSSIDRNAESGAQGIYIHIDWHTNTLCTHKSSIGTTSRRIGNWFQINSRSYRAVFLLSLFLFALNVDVYLECDVHKLVFFFVLPLCLMWHTVFVHYYSRVNCSNSMLFCSVLFFLCFARAITIFSIENAVCVVFVVF